MINFHGSDWQEISDEIRRRITELDIKNRASRPEAETSHIRGQIAALQSLLNLETNAAIPIETEEMIPPP